MDSLIPKMNAEAGFEVVESDVVPLRVSGYLCLILGGLSVLGLIGLPLIAFQSLYALYSVSQ